MYCKGTKIPFSLCLVSMYACIDIMFTGIGMEVAVTGIRVSPDIMFHIIGWFGTVLRHCFKQYCVITGVSLYSLP